MYSHPGFVGDGVCTAHWQHRGQWAEFAAQALGCQVRCWGGGTSTGWKVCIMGVLTPFLYCGEKVKFSSSADLLVCLCSSDSGSLWVWSWSQSCAPCWLGMSPTMRKPSALLQLNLCQAPCPSTETSLLQCSASWLSSTTRNSMWDPDPWLNHIITLVDAIPETQFDGFVFLIFRDHLLYWMLWAESSLKLHLTSGRPGKSYCLHRSNIYGFLNMLILEASACLLDLRMHN